MGTSDSGHYYSYIRDRTKLDENNEDIWYEFNDTIITYFDPSEIPNEAYGGEEKVFFIIF